VASKQKHISVSDLEYVDTFVGQTWHKLNNKSIFISGGTGIIGKWLLATIKYEIKKRGLKLKVVVLSRNPKKFWEKFPHLCGNHLKWIKGDISTFKLSGKYVYDYAIHGATDIEKRNKAMNTLLTCINGTKNFFSQITKCKCKRILVLSSGAVYGKPFFSKKNIRETDFGSINPLDSQSAYAEGKKVSELIAFLHSKTNTPKVIIARCFAMVGPYLPLDAHFAIGNFIRDAINGDDVIIKSDGSALRSYLYLSDVASRLWLLLLIGKQKAYNIGSPVPISIGSLARCVIKVLKSSSQEKTKKIIFKNAHSSSYVPDVTLFESDYKKYKYLPLQKAILKTAEWYS